MNLRFLFCLLLLFWLGSPALVSGQVLTLNRSECVQVEARIDELVPYHKYQRLKIIECGTGLLDQNRVKPDTASMKIEDDITIFFVWRNNAVLRIVARRERNMAFIAKADPQHSFPVVRLAGHDQAEVNRQLLQFQGGSTEPFLSFSDPNPYSWNYAAVTAKVPINMDVFRGGIFGGFDPRVHLLVHGKSLPDSWFRILHISGFGKSLAPDATQPYRTELEPVFNFYRYNAGFTQAESRQMMEAEAEPENWISGLKRKIKDFFSKSGTGTRKNVEWFYKLDRIYEQLFWVTWDGGANPYEGNRSLPYFSRYELQNLPWQLGLEVFPDHNRPLKTIFRGERVVGYQVFNDQSHPETRGFVVVLGKFFLPRRLKILSVNGIPWLFYQPTLFDFSPEVQIPYFPGGMPALKPYVNPVFARTEFSVGGYTTIAISVNVDGKVTFLPQNDSFYPAEDSLGTIIAGSLPRWLPGLQAGRPVRTQVRIPVPALIIGSLRDYTDQNSRVNREPEFPGGSAFLQSFIQKNMRYPARELQEKIEGTVILQFFVTEKGEIIAIKILKSFSPALDKEAVRLLKSMPKWDPGKANGLPVSKKVTLPFFFRLPSETVAK